MPSVYGPWTMQDHPLHLEDSDGGTSVTLTAQEFNAGFGQDPHPIIKYTMPDGTKELFAGVQNYRLYDLTDTNLYVVHLVPTIELPDLSGGWKFSADTNPIWANHSFTLYQYADGTGYYGVDGTGMWVDATVTGKTLQMRIWGPNGTTREEPMATLTLQNPQTQVESAGGTVNAIQWKPLTDSPGVRWERTDQAVPTPQKVSGSSSDSAWQVTPSAAGISYHLTGSFNPAESYRIEEDGSRTIIGYAHVTGDKFTLPAGLCPPDATVTIQLTAGGKTYPASDWFGGNVILSVPNDADYAMDAPGKVVTATYKGWPGDISVLNGYDNGGFSTGPHTYDLTITITPADSEQSSEPPALSQVSDQTLSPGQNSFSTALSLASAYADMLQYDAAAVSLAYTIKQSQGLHSDGNYDTNWGGQQEKWVQGNAGNWYYLLPNGQLFQWDNHSVTAGTPLNGQFIANLDTSAYQDPRLLYNAQPGGATVAYSWDRNGQIDLNVTPDAGFSGKLTVTYSITDPHSARLVDRKQFVLTVPTRSTQPAAPILLDPSGSTSRTATPTFAWYAVTGADHYEVWVSPAGNDSAKAAYASSVTGTQYTSGQPLVAGSYKLWVRAWDASGNASAWSEVAFSVAVTNPGKRVAILQPR